MFLVQWTTDGKPQTFKGDGMETVKEMAGLVQSEEEWKRLRLFLFGTDDLRPKFEEPGRYTILRLPR